ncbi:hypothetical protein CC86DRAFT_372355 [Ophiobolus disseminans]|uniref:Uncharacterized protein n=1 Tax=Ophiobolus disseminans TaxID=1469910 RepID=A0A6A6ZRH0_9PLEO|nr:hypothetical protein CC86DRAFT_372355 [Ophiobolus disseminans]
MEPTVLVLFLHGTLHSLAPSVVILEVLWASLMAMQCAAGEGRLHRVPIFVSEEEVVREAQRGNWF